VPPKRIGVRSATGPCAVAYGHALVQRAATELRALGPHTGLFLLSSPRVACHWRKPLETSLRGAGWRATILFDDRETAKSMHTVERVCRQLVRAGADRRALLVAAGGGVVGDVAGFVAASYLRGVRLVHVPTTLVGQVDSAIGGKTGVNLPEGKNLVGAFYPAQLVLADPKTLSTLPAREFRSGLYEVVKYGVIADLGLFVFLEKHLGGLVRGDSTALDFVIPRCIAIKAAVVSRDERESGLREILNFGHTFAHAFETATSFRRYLHGEAVAWGMIAAARLAERIGMLHTDAARRIESLVRRVGPLPPMPGDAPSELIALMASDKKTRGGKLRFVLARRIGYAKTVAEVPLAAVRRVLADLQKGSAHKP
jgi:3-dehydroquinate synthase